MSRLLFLMLGFIGPAKLDALDYGDLMKLFFYWI